MTTRNHNPNNKKEAILFFIFDPSADGVGKIKLKLTTLPRIVIHVVCRFSSTASHQTPNVTIPAIIGHVHAVLHARDKHAINT